MKVTLKILKAALLERGWRVDHESKGSYYLSSKYELMSKEIRISDHKLGSKHGERQGLHWDLDVVIDKDLTLEDHLKAIDNPDYLNGGGGFLEGYSYTEWLSDHGGA